MPNYAEFNEPPEDLLTYKPNTVIALIDSEEEVRAAFQELQDAGISPAQMFVLAGKHGAERLDPSGRSHGIRGRLTRLAEHFGEESEILERHARHMEQGGFGVLVPASEDEVDAVSEILHRHGAHDAHHLGKGHWEPIGP